MPHPTALLRFLLPWTCLLATLPYTCALAQSPLREHVRTLTEDPDLRGATISLNVIDVATGAQLAGHNATLAAIPASTLKLITTAAALDLLGADHRMRTRLFVTGELRDGVLNGDVYLVGDGDPSLGSPYLDGVPRLPALLDRWATALERAGIERITGRVIGEGSHLGTDGPAAGWPWADLGNYYGAGAYGLNVHENFYFLDLLQRGTLGATPPVQRVRPAVPGLRLTNELRSAPRGSGDQAYIFGAPFGYDNYLRGTIPVGSGRFTIKGAIPDPPLFLAQQLTDRLREGGMAVNLPAETDRTLGGGRYTDGRVLDEYRSPPLLTLVERTNLRSNNLYAEALLRALNKSRGLPRAELSGTAVLTEWLIAQGIDVTPVRIEDGSGLATRNFLPARTMTDFLRARAGDRAWVNTLPLSGRSGSMSGYLKGPATVGRVYAKSGSLGAVRCYAGYVDRADGRRLAFAVMVNNFTIESREVRDKLHRFLSGLCTGTLPR